MNNLRLVLMFISLTAAACQSVPSNATTTTTTKTCYYCGVRKNCQIPFDEESTDTIQCKKSCYQFNGYADDGTRVVVRDCGFFHAQECVYSYPYEGDKTVVGTMCHCMTDLCNGAQGLEGPDKLCFVLLLATSIKLFV